MENILKILETGESQKKIEILETLHNTDNLKILQQIISRLNDDSIQVRGEAFNKLILKQNKISKILRVIFQPSHTLPLLNKCRPRHLQVEYEGITLFCLVNFS